jgi:hypothetical protein
MIVACQHLTIGAWIQTVYPPNKVGPWDNKKSMENVGSTDRDNTADIQMPNNGL